MPKRFCQCQGCQACGQHPGSHGTLFDADSTKTLKCPACQAQATAQRQARAPRASRGYDARHDAERARWAPVVAEGRARCTETVCLETTRSIIPGTPWDLAHNEDRTGYKGPAHRRCNRATNRRR